MRTLFTFLIFLGTGQFAFGQVKKSAQGIPGATALPAKDVSPGQADAYFKSGNYYAALKQYIQLMKKDSLNVEYHYRAARSILALNNDRKKAVPHLEFVVKQPTVENQALYDMGHAYHLALKFDDAIKYFNLYKQKTNDAKADRQIEMCNNAKILVKKPVNVIFENIGEGVNTAFPDYYPWITNNEENLIFTSRRPSNIGGKEVDFDGLRPSDIYISTVLKGEFAKTQNLGPLVNTSYDEQAVGIAPDGSQIILYIDWVEVYGDLLTTKRTGKSYQKTVPLNENINTLELETSGNITPDGKIIFFASKSVGTTGGTDLYMSRLLPDDTWGPKTSLGTEINTPYNEDFPYPYPDGKVLYFSSEGHNSMGGFDLFTSTYDEEKQIWSKPENLGYPINTPDDNMNISFALLFDWNESNTEKVPGTKYGYVSVWRPDSKGDLDIYRIKYETNEVRYTMLKGTMTAKIPAANKQFTKEPIAEAEISVTNEESGDLYGTFKAKNGKYLMTLQPGKYSIDVDVTGYKPYQEKIVIFDKASFVDMMEKNIELTK